MALPLSGQLSMSDIAGELGIVGQLSLGYMSVQAGFSTPDAISDFYGYSAVTVTDVYVRSNLNSGSYYVYSEAAGPFSQLSSNAFIRSEWDVSWYNYQYRYSYFQYYSKNYTFTNENDLFFNSRLGVYEPNASPYLMNYYNIDLDPNDSANIINV